MPVPLMSAFMLRGACTAGSSSMLAVATDSSAHGVEVVCRRAVVPSMLTVCAGRLPDDVLPAESKGSILPAARQDRVGVLAGAASGTLVSLHILHFQEHFFTAEIVWVTVFAGL